MYFLFLWEVLKRAFTPTPRMTDGLQIAAASALPAAAKFAGFEMAESATDDALAYIGLVALAFFVIRIFWAPYAIWREQGGEIGALKLELTKPERMIMEHLAKHRARARAKLAAALEDYQTLAFYESWSGEGATTSGKLMSKIRRLQAEAGLPDLFDDARKCLVTIVVKEGDKPNSELPLHRESERILTAMQQYLVGTIADEDLVRQLPPNTELKIPQ
jgi:hypothetical protein